MIKINLISKGAAAAASSGVTSSADMSLDENNSEIQKQGIIRAFIILLGPLALYLWQNQNLPAKLSLVNQKQNILNELTRKNDNAKSAVDEIKKYKANEAKLKEQISTIESLRKDRMSEVRILDLIQREMPERMWLSKIEIRESKLSISGYAAADSEITIFMDTLAKSMNLQDVNLVGASEKVIDGTQLKEFVIGAGIKRTELFQNNSKSASGGNG